MGVPKAHRHLRVLIETKKGALYVFQGATVANMVRAYVTLKTHPSIYGSELINKDYDGGLKEGHAKSPTHGIREEFPKGYRGDEQTAPLSLERSG